MKEARTLPLLRNLPREVRLFAAMIMLALGLGYAHALAYVYQTTRIVPAGIEQRFRGTETNPSTESTPSTASAEELEDTTEAAPPPTITGELQYQKSLAEMLNIIHTHILSMTFLFSLSGLITLMTASTGTKFRKFVVIEPFIGILVTFAGLWLMRYVHPAFSWLVSLSGTLMALAFAGQCWAVIQEMKFAREGAETALLQ
ncbi:MAG TPA: hypothetical protein VFH95_07415 [Candidatus Kapabacteria bacterium]|nr:hypothetical protein [Candidatus Kapabacteria bacterium]